MFLKVIFISTFIFASEIVAKPTSCPAKDGKDPTYIPDEDCTKFWECSNGTPYLFDCPAGLHFNPKLNVCDFPYRAGCKGDGSGDSDNNGGNNGNNGGDNGNNGGDNGNEGNGPKCPAHDGEYPTYIPDEDCTRFWECSNGIPYLFNCSAGLHFNPKLNVCDFPHRAGCNGDGSDNNGNNGDNGNNDNNGSDNDNNGGDNGNNGGDNSDNGGDNGDNGGDNGDNGGDNGDNGGDNGNGSNGTKCPPHDGGYPTYIPDEDCTKFWECSNGTPYLFDCPAGLHFNPKLNVCDFPYRAGCNGDGSGDDNNNDNNGGDNGNNGGDNGNNGGDNGNDGGDNGNDGGDNSNDGGDNGNGSNGPKCPAHDGAYPTYIPDEDCTKFWECSNGTPYLFTCPGGLHFNPKLNVCDFIHRAGCNGGGGDDDDNNGNNGDDNDNNGGDDGNNGGDNGNDGGDNGENDGDGDNGNNGSDNDNNGGDNGNNGDDNDNNGGDNGNNGGDNGNNGNGSNGPHCPAQDGEYPTYIPDEDCTKFWECSNGIPYLFNCSAGLHFNPKLNVCDFPYRAGCNGNNGDNGGDNGNNGGDNGNNGGDNGNSGGDNGNNGGDNGNGSNGPKCPAHDGEYPTYIPDEDCTKFWECSNGIPYLFNCSAGLHFNPKLNVCDFPYRAGCNADGDSDDGNNGNNGDDNDNNGGDNGNNGGDNGNNGGDDGNNGGDNGDNGGDNGNGSSGPKCPAQNGEYPTYIPDEDCTKFWECSHGIPHLFNCSAGLHFNPNLNACDYPSRAGCQGDSNSGDDNNGNNGGDNGNNGDNGNDGGNDGDNGNNGSGTCLTNSSGNVPKCPARDNAYPTYIPHEDCGKFWECSNGTPCLFDCPANLHFNPKLNVCDWPQNAGCI